MARVFFQLDWMKHLKDEHKVNIHFGAAMKGEATEMWEMNIFLTI